MLSLLPSDYFFLLIITFIIYAVRSACNSEHQKVIWQKLFQSHVACCSAVVLVFFFVVASLDSIHFKNNGVYYTAFDKLVEPIGKFDETSFSEPMALNSFVYETRSEAGKVVRYKPKLQHVKGRSQQDNFINLALDLVYAAVALLIILRLISWRRGLHCWFRNETNQIARKTITICSFTLLAIIFICKDFSNYYFLLGTDKIGFDVLYMVLKSIRTGLALSLITIMFMVPMAVIMGLSAGYFGGRVDSVIQYIYTTLSSIPGVLLIAAAVLSLDMYMYKNSTIFDSIMYRADVRLLSLCLILGLTGWTSLCRLLRGEALKLRELDFIVHARVVGMNSCKIIFKHILPNVMHIVIITSVLDFSGLVLAEAVLSYLGVGVDPTMHSWGNIINSARLELARDPIVWWPLAGAVMAMFLLVLSVNLIADKVRSLRDPRSL